MSHVPAAVLLQIIRSLVVFICKGYDSLVCEFMLTHVHAAECSLVYWCI